MSTVVNCATYDAFETRLMKIECSFAQGFAGMQLIGNTSEVCRDGKERARIALEALNILIPPQRLVVSFTPADVKKDGSQFDLPLAVSLAMLISERPPAIAASQWLFAAELGLSGELKPVRGVISFALLAIKHNLEGIVVAEESLHELAALASLALPEFNQLKVFGFRNLGEVLAWTFDGQLDDALTPAPIDKEAMLQNDTQLDFNDMVLDEELSKLALTVAVGKHSLLLQGTPGSGKSMFAARLPSILAPMDAHEHLEALRLASAYAARIPTPLLAGRPPFRTPHHQASASAILGTHDRPGELSLAHGGVLFLDELPEFRRDILEGLREPLESGEVSVSRSRQKVVWKAKILLLAACNNCPCGWFASERRRCRCGVNQVRAYRHRISGPVLDRIDIHFNMKEISTSNSELFAALCHTNYVSKTEMMRARVLEALEFAKKRNKKFGTEFNRDLRPVDLVDASGLKHTDFVRLVETSCQSKPSKRSLMRAIRVARTLADLDLSEQIRAEDMQLAWSWQAEEAARMRGDHMLGV